MLDLICIGKTLKTLRTDHGFSQEKLAEKLYVTHQAISRWEQGKSLPSIESLVALSKLYNQTLETLLCFNPVYEGDLEDLFNTHSRRSVIDDVINKAMPFKAKDIIQKLSEEERYYLLNKLALIDTFPLFPRLSLSERRFLINKVLDSNKDLLNALLEVCTEQERQIIRRSIK